MLKKYLLPGVLLALIIGINTFRFIGLDRIPNGMQIDELTSGVTLACLAQDGSSPLAETRYPIFAKNSFASPIPPTYLYPGMLWVKAFGFSPAALRSFTVFCVTLGLLGLFMIGWHMKGPVCGLWVLLAGSMSPWVWPISRIAWESLFFLTFMVWGLYFCLRTKHYRDLIIAGILLSGAAYCYPTARLHVPLFLIVMSIYGLTRLNWKFTHLIALGAGFAVTSIPLIVLYISDPVLSARFKAIAITNPEYLKSIGSSGSLWDLSRIVLKNFLTHLHPDYLFFKGTPNNLTLSTGHQGIMSWLDSTAVLAALGWLIWKIKNKVTIASKGTVAWLGFLGVNIFIGIIPATLISIDNPHTLRTIGAWPFAMLATGFILHRMTQEHLWRAWAAVSIGALFTVIFLRQYFVDYAKYSGGFFSVWTMEEAKNAKTNDAWMNFLYRYHYHMFLSRYYLMRYHGDSCVQARTTWENLYPMFKKLHEQNDPKKP